MLEISIMINLKYYHKPKTSVKLNRNVQQKFKKYCDKSFCQVPYLNQKMPAPAVQNEKELLLLNVLLQNF